MSDESPFENHIRRLRFDRGEMTQEDVASQIGVSRQTVIALEKNRYVPSLLLAAKLARLFEVPIEQVFTLSKNA